MVLRVHSSDGELFYGGCYALLALPHDAGLHGQPDEHPGPAHRPHRALLRSSDTWPAGGINCGVVRPRRDEPAIDVSRPRFNWCHGTWYEQRMGVW